MHISNLGIAWPLIASAICWLVVVQAHLILDPAVSIRLGPDASKDDILKDLALRFKKFLKNHKMNCTFPRFTQANLHWEKAGQVPLYRCKAAASPKLISWLASITLEISERCPPALRPEAKVVAACLWGKASYYHILRYTHFSKK